MATKITSFVTDDYRYMWDSFHLLWFHKHDILSCLFVKVCQWLWLKAWGRKAQRSCCVVCAKWRLDYPCFRSSYSLGILSIGLGMKRIRHLLRVFDCVFPRFLVANELHIQNTTHPQCESWRFVSNATRTRSSSLTCCKIEETCLWHEWCPSTLVERFGQSMWFRHEFADVVMSCTQPKSVTQIVTERALHEGMAQKTSHFNRVCDHREMQQLRECWIPLKEAMHIRGRNYKLFLQMISSEKLEPKWNNVSWPDLQKTFPSWFRWMEWHALSQDKESVGWGIFDQDQALRSAKNSSLKSLMRSQSIETQKDLPLHSNNAYKVQKPSKTDKWVLQSRTQFQCWYKFSGCAPKAASPTIGDF